MTIESSLLFEMKSKIYIQELWTKIKNLLLEFLENIGIS